MGQYGFYFDAQTCVGCKCCQVSCKNKNNLDVGVLFRVVYDVEGGSWEATDKSFVPSGVFGYHVALGCNHCANPACVAVCPSGAMQKDPDTGVVWTDHEVCIGCRSCENACPYHAPRFLESEGVMGKCDFCKDQLERGEDPYCVRVCALRALKYGDIDELRAEYGEGNVEIAPLPSNTTEPSLVLNPHAQAVPGSAEGDYIVTSFEYEI